MVEVTRTTPLPTIAGYGVVLGAHIGVVVLGAVLGTASGYALSRQAEPAYLASASIELPDVPTWVDTDPVGPAPDRTTIDTTSELVFTEQVFSAVAQATGLPEENFDDKLSVSAYPLSRVLIVTFEARRPELAVLGADAAATELIRERVEVLAGSQLRPARQLYKRLRTLQGQARTSSVPFGVVTQLRAVMEHVGTLERNNRNARATLFDEAGPAEPVNSHPELPIVTGLLLGLLGGVTYAWWRSG